MRMSVPLAVDVDMCVGLPVVRVFMNMHVVLECTAQAPDANAKQDDADESLRP